MWIGIVIGDGNVKVVVVIQDSLPLVSSQPAASLRRSLQLFSSRPTSAMALTQAARCWLAGWLSSVLCSFPLPARLPRQRATNRDGLAQAVLRRLSFGRHLPCPSSSTSSPRCDETFYFPPPHPLCHFHTVAYTSERPQFTSSRFSASPTSHPPLIHSPQSLGPAPIPSFRHRQHVRRAQ